MQNNRAFCKRALQARNLWQQILAQLITVKEWVHDAVKGLNFNIRKAEPLQGRPNDLKRSTSWLFKLLVSLAARHVFNIDFRH